MTKIETPKSPHHPPHPTPPPPSLCMHKHVLWWSLRRYGLGCATVSFGAVSLNYLFRTYLNILVVIWTVQSNDFFLQGATVSSGPGPPNFEGSRSHWDIWHSIGLLSMSDKPATETSTYQHKTLRRGKRQCSWWDSNPRSQKVSGRSPTP